MQPVKRYVYTPLGMYPRDDDPPSVEHWVRWEDHKTAVAAEVQAAFARARTARIALGRRCIETPSIYPEQELSEQLHRHRAEAEDPDEKDGCE